MSTAEEEGASVAGSLILWRCSSSKGTLKFYFTVLVLSRLFSGSRPNVLLVSGRRWFLFQLIYPQFVSELVSCSVQRPNKEDF